MVECNETVCRIDGDITVTNAASILTELKPHISRNVSVLDFSSTAQVDSSVLALILSCQREAAMHNYTLRFSEFPSRITTLADLYGVASLLQP